MANSILVIDDEEKIRTLLARIIGLEGFDVYEAANCKMALKKLEQQEPDAVLCDVKLPDCNGVDLVKRDSRKIHIDNKMSMVMLYPNPARDKINMTINVSQREKLQWQLLDNTGRMVKRGNYDLSTGSTAVRIDINNLSSGIYFMQLKGSSLQQVIKVIKQ